MEMVQIKSKSALQPEGACDICPFGFGVLLPILPQRLQKLHIVVGLAQGATCVSSDLPSILHLTRRVLRIQDGEMVIDTKKMIVSLSNPPAKPVETIDAAAAHHRARLATPKLNQWLSRAVEQQGPAMAHGKRPRFFYATQTATAPPTITVFSSSPQHIQPSYERYLVNRLRGEFDLQGTPVRVRFRERSRAKRQSRAHT